MFNCLKDLPVVRLSTLIEQLDNTVRVQAGMKIAAKLNKSKVSRKDYAIGVCLVEFLVERKLIIVKTVNGYTEDVLQVYKGKGALKCYAMCNFDISLLPIKLNLPMVCKPLDWTSKKVSRA